MQISKTELQKQAAKWFAERFIADEKAQQFVMLRNGWTFEELSIKESNLKYRIDRYTRYHLLFKYSVGYEIEVIPCDLAAAWADGFILLDGDGILSYTTTGVPSSFGISESDPQPAPLSTD